MRRAAAYLGALAAKNKGGYTIRACEIWIARRYPSLRNHVRIAALGYRDLSEGKRQFKGPLAFTKDMDEVATFLSKIKAGGGDDFPEDIAGALIKVRQPLALGGQACNMSSACRSRGGEAC